MPPEFFVRRSKYFLFPATFHVPWLYIGQSGREMSPKKGIYIMKRNVTAIILCAIVVLALAACGVASAANDEPDEIICGDDPATWGPTEHSSLSEAEGAAGINLQVPEKILDTGASEFLTWYGEKYIEAIYADGGNETARVRKAADIEDISGDYNEYPAVTELNIDGNTVTFKGENGMIMLAVWTADGCGYAVSVPGGVSTDAMTELVKQVK